MAYVLRAVAGREEASLRIERISHEHQFALGIKTTRAGAARNYLRDCMVDIGHLPRKCKVVGSEAKCHADGAENALNTIYSGNKNDAFTPLR